jgi:RNA polymerase sigma factor (TIGR02999 family)
LRLADSSLNCYDFQVDRENFNADNFMTDGESEQQTRLTPAENSPPDPRDSGDRHALDQLVVRQYDRLKKLAARVRWSDARTSLTATALLNEAYIKLSKAPADLEGKQHDEILAIIANAMREILIDQARSRGALKRGAGDRGRPLDETTDVLSDISSLSREDILTIESARKQLEELNPQAARILDCRFYLGMTTDETARALRLSKTMVERESREAKQFLRSRLQPPKQP